MLSSLMARHKIALKISQKFQNFLVSITPTFDCLAPPSVFISCYLDCLLSSFRYLCVFYLPYSPTTCFCSSIGLLSNICDIDPLLVSVF